MSTVKQLRIVMQAMGMYCVVHSLFAVSTAIARYFSWQSVDHTVRASMRPFLIESFVYAALLLIGAWILLAKADWLARAVADMPGSRDEEEFEEEEELAG
jgi:hypothetical protein